MSERCTLSEMTHHLSAAAVEATEPVEGAWLKAQDIWAPLQSDFVAIYRDKRRAAREAQA